KTSKKLEALLRRQATIKQNYMAKLAEYEEAQVELEDINRKIKEEAENQTTEKSETVKLKPAKPRVVIDSLDNIPHQYRLFHQQRSPDLHKIQLDLNAGIEVPGVHLESSKTIKVC